MIRKNIFVDVKAKIIYDSTPGDILDQFIRFCRVFDRQIGEHGRTREAVEETLRICRDENVLRDYLRDEEAATIMFTLLDEQKARKFWEEELKQEGRDEGENRLNALMQKLFSLHRFEDAERCTTDPTYRKKLYEEFQLS